MPFLTQLVYREYHTRVLALQSTQKLIPPPEDTCPSSQPEESAPIDQDGAEMEVEDWKKVEIISVELKNQQLVIESDMPVVIDNVETIPSTENYIDITGKKQ